MGAIIYLKIKEKILKEIQDMPANTPITSERELASRYHASRMTIRSAINELVEEGLLYREKNRGTFVADQKLQKKNTSTQVLSRAKTEDQNYKIIYFSTCFSDETIAPHLELHGEDWMIRIVRLNLRNEKPQNVEEIYYVQSLISDGDCNDINKLLDLNCNVDAGAVTQRFHPITVPVKYVNLLHVKLDTPIIMVESTIVSKSGSPIIYIREYNNPFERIIEITT